MKKYSLYAFFLYIATLLAACNPTVEVKAPEEPITINMNIKIKVDKELDDVFADDSGLF